MYIIYTVAFFRQDFKHGGVTEFSDMSQKNMKANYIAS